MHVDHPPRLADLEHQGVGGHERVWAGSQRPGPKRLDGGVEFLGHHRHLRLRQRRDAQSLDQLVHPPRRHPQQIAGGHHRRQGPLGAFVAFQQPIREVRAVPQLGDRQIQTACTGFELALSIAVALIRPVAATFAVSGAAQHVGLRTHQGMDERGQQLAQHVGVGGGEARWAIDLTSPMALMLITVLLGAEQSVVYVPGHVVNTMTGAFRAEGKTDAKDARGIAETARMRSDLSEVAMPDELVVELAQLSGYRTDVMADWVRGVNRLRSLLGSIFPGLEGAVDHSDRTPLILVAHLCTPAEIRAAGITGVTAYLGDKGGWPTAIAKTAATAGAAAKQQPLALPGEAGTAALVKRLAGKLLDLDHELKNIA